ncbi:hypothetical protein OROMI_011626 [Orobanche minor]
MSPLTTHQLQNRPLTSSSILLKFQFQFSKITLFLHLQTTHTIQIHSPLSFFLVDLLPRSREKLSKWVRMSFGATHATPIHSVILRHGSSTSGHSRRRCAADSTTVAQDGHNLPSGESSMHLHKFSLVGIRFRSTRHATTCCLKGAADFQIAVDDSHLAASHRAAWEEIKRTLELILGDYPVAPVSHFWHTNKYTSAASLDLQFTASIRLYKRLQAEYEPECICIFEAEK